MHLRVREECCFLMLFAWPSLPVFKRHGKCIRPAEASSESKGGISVVSQQSFMMTCQIELMIVPDWNCGKLCSNSVRYAWLKAPIPKCPKCLLSIWIAAHNAGSLHRCSLSVSFANNALIIVRVYI